MKKIILLLAFLLYSAYAIPQNNLPTFADMDWGISASAVKSKLTASGFTVSTDPDGDIKFEGKLLGYPAGGWAVIVNNRLIKVNAQILTPDHKARVVFNEMKDVLIEKYGSPSNVYEFFSSPYYEGDGYEELAIKTGKGRFSIFWKTHLMLTITEGLTVSLVYEAPDWEKESERRKRRSTSVF